MQKQNAYHVFCSFVTFSHEIIWLPIVGVGGFMIRQLTRKFVKRQLSVDDLAEDVLRMYNVSCYFYYYVIFGYKT